MTDQSKFSVWLGDNWPGPYVVTFEMKRPRAARTTTVVVNGVASVSEALAVAHGEFDIPEDVVESVTVVPAKVAEASHHMGLLARHRDDATERRAAARAAMEA